MEKKRTIRGKKTSYKNKTRLFFFFQTTGTKKKTHDGTVDTSIFDTRGQDLVAQVKKKKKERYLHLNKTTKANIQSHL